MKFIKIFFVLLILAGAGGYYAYNTLFKVNLNPQKSAQYFFVKKGDTSKSILNKLSSEDWITDKTALSISAKVMQYHKAKVYTGRFQFDSLATNKDILTILRTGKQSPVNLIINEVRTYDQIVGKICNQLELDSTTFIQYIEEKYKTKETILCAFIPDTYKVYWNTSVEMLTKRLKKEKNTFWKSNDREKKAKNLNMTLDEVYTLASIVEKETNYNGEKKRIAGVYLNRLKKGILLQADPTVVYANNDFTIKRVLNKHLAKDNPYNTYLYAGLPPGPIYMSSKSSIDAVLNAEDHDYIYFCAKADNSGQHAFAKTLKGHNQNANKYRRWLSNNGY